MSNNNPFCLSFGKEPDRFVERTDAYSNIAREKWKKNHYQLKKV